MENKKDMIDTTYTEENRITITNKTNKNLCIHYNEPHYNDNYDPILLAPFETITIYQEYEADDWRIAFEKGWYYIL